MNRGRRSHRGPCCRGPPGFQGDAQRSPPSMVARCAFLHICAKKTTICPQVSLLTSKSTSGWKSSAPTPVFASSLIASRLSGAEAFPPPCNAGFFQGLSPENCSSLSVVLPFLSLHVNSFQRVGILEDVFDHLRTTSPKQRFGDIVQHACSSNSAGHVLFNPHNLPPLLLILMLERASW